MQMELNIALAWKVLGVHMTGLLLVTKKYQVQTNTLSRNTKSEDLKVTETAFSHSPTTLSNQI